MELITIFVLISGVALGFGLAFILLSHRNKLTEQQLNEVKIKIGVLEDQNRAATEGLKTTDIEKRNFRDAKIEADTKLAAFEAKFREKDLDLRKLEEENRNLTRQITQLQEQEPHRIDSFNQKLQTLNLTIQLHQQEQEKAKRLAEEEALKELQRLKETWSRHEKEVEDKMKLICQQIPLDYIDKESFPFSGKPDNCVKIADEYIIFDSKSPQGEDLSNLPTYIKAQAEAAKKYLKSPEVKKELFFVVPSNAISAIKETCLNLGSYVVHVITPDALRPVLLQLKKIENYEFAEQLSPEEREQIAITIGKMAHSMKRTIQVSQYMNKEMISVLFEAEKLPSEVLVKARETETKIKLNPTADNRRKAIETQDLNDEHNNVYGKLSGQSIYFGDDLKAIEALPLHAEHVKDKV